MDISDRAQEILEKYWLINREQNKKWDMEIMREDPVARELTTLGYASGKEGRIELTRKGWDEARSCVRRHRLAERLLEDVLNIRGEKTHEIGCRLEHVLHKDVEENICTLLGHPAKCPHGSPIPPGACCLENKKHPRKIIRSLSELDVNEKGRIAYLRSEKADMIKKLTAMGILPGGDIQLLCKKPAYLFKIGHSQFAVDKSLAESILVRA